MGRAVYLIPIDEDVAPSQLSQEQVDAYGKVNDAIGLPWKLDANSDLHPTGVDPLPGIGNLEYPVGHLVVGDTTGIEGGISAVSDANNGGIVVAGLRDVDPGQPIPEPIPGNAPVELNGAYVLIAGGGLYLELPGPLMEDHELILRPSIQVPDGRHFAPIAVGPVKEYGNTQQAEDSQDLDLGSELEQDIISMVLTDNYPSGASFFTYNITLENLSSRDSIFTVRIKVDGNTRVTEEHYLAANTLTFTRSYPLISGVLIGQTILLTAELTKTHQHSQGWVRGTVNPTQIKIQK